MVQWTVAHIETRSFFQHLRRNAQLLEKNTSRVKIQHLRRNAQLLEKTLPVLKERVLLQSVRSRKGSLF
jgi:hypothetical protein